MSVSSIHYGCFYFKHILKKDYAFYQKFRTGDIVTRLTDDLSDFPKVAWFLCSGIFRAVNSFSMIAFSLAVMFSLNWLLTLLSIASLPFMMIIFYITSDKLYLNFQKNQQAISNINNQLEMSFSGIRIIKAFVSEEKYNRFFETALANRFKTEMSVVKLNAILHLIYEYIDYFVPDWSYCIWRLDGSKRYNFHRYILPVLYLSIYDDISFIGFTAVIRIRKAMLC